MSARSITIGLLAFVATGCASMRERPGFTRVQELGAGGGAGDATWIQGTAESSEATDQVRALLGPELGVDAALRIALLRNPTLQASYERLGIAEAELVEAGLLRNPVLVGAYMPGVGPLAGARSVEVELTQNLLQLFLMPARKRIETQRFEGVQLDVAARVLDVAAETRRAWYALVAQRNTLETLHVMEQVADASAELGGRLHAAGNWSALELSREQGLAEDARLARLQAEAALAAPREALARLLGLRGDEGAWDVPDRLPPLPVADPAFEADGATALEGRFDLASARRFQIALGEAVELQRTWRFVPFVEAGVATASEPGEGWTVGPALALELPIFQQGQPALARLESELRRSEREIETLEVDARASAREAVARLASARALAERYARVTIPLRQRTTAQAREHYDAMLIGIFEVIAAKQDEMAAYAGYIDAVRDWWIALADLERASGRRLDVAAAGTSPQIEGLPVDAVPGASEGHEGHPSHHGGH